MEDDTLYGRLAASREVSLVRRGADLRLPRRSRRGLEPFSRIEESDMRLVSLRRSIETGCCSCRRWLSCHLSLLRKLRHQLLT